MRNKHVNLNIRSMSHVETYEIYSGSLLFQALPKITVTIFTHVYWDCVCVIGIILIFQNLGLTSLYKLQLQRNHIGTIDLHAFSGVRELRILDLSYNHLYYILPETFEDTPRLRSLYLQGNRLKINPGPILIIPALEVCLCFHVYV